MSWNLDQARFPQKQTWDKDLEYVLIWEVILVSTDNNVGKWHRKVREASSTACIMHPQAGYGCRQLGSGHWKPQNRPTERWRSWGIDPPIPLHHWCMAAPQTNSPTHLICPKHTPTKRKPLGKDSEVLVAACQADSRRRANRLWAGHQCHLSWEQITSS